MPKKAFVYLLTLALLAALCAGCRNSAASSASRPSGGSSSYASSGSAGSGGMSGSGPLSGGASSGLNGGMSGSAGSGAMSGDSGILSGDSGLLGDDSGLSQSGSGTAGGASGSGSGSMGSGSSGSGTAGSGTASFGPFSGSTPAAATAAAPADADTWMTRLVNAQNPLPEDFTVETARISGYDERLFDKRAAPELEAMLADAEAAGCKLYLVSGYRSVARQKALFERKTNAFLAEGFDRAEAERQAAMWVARPGASEHNTGLAADLVSADWYATHDDLTADFADTPEFAWLSAHCAEYGFILRYPKGKENITGVTYEPWHYRYVGREAAAAIQEAGGTLEEYRAPAA